MKKKFSNLAFLKESLSVTIISLIGCTGIIFCILYVDMFHEGFFVDYSAVIKSVFVGIISVLVIITLVFYRLNKTVIYKLFFITVIFITATLISLYLLKTSGFLENVGSIEGLREYIASRGSYASLTFLLLQFMQVVILPIPAFVTVGAGVLLFGALKGAILSAIGIILGSVVAFYVGRGFGYKVVCWLIGKSSLENGLNAIKGKGKLILTFMFIFPFFPDDVLCFVAGVTTISSKFFITMIFITRIISVFASSFSINGNIIPYDSWWGILLWAIFILFTVVLTFIVYKKGERIERFFKRRLKKSSKDK